ncbi:SDR family oxidoreductase [Poseidonocella sedimentorum]|uniref:NADP-dependent 3-hydroxy acid dehydrogenase YdfG n=1 Tax=Poseidonocella sedimentorum TaxID=871652 RepID=A0A1I6E9C1_9RHOB|nr:SDR family oxidoreductase [Poseidonocella sedimentorum]SFR14353.1 NADP-dependent 3-hydroxy acid dehydrogenase YdfG [Poseidonocella sedimentorum]
MDQSGGIDLMGKVVLITGASRGIGAAAARAFSEAGAAVGLAARSAADLEAVARDLPGPSVSLRCDVSDRADVDRAVAQTVEAFGRIDVLVNNAGAMEPIAHIEDADPESWGKIIDINLKGVFYGMRAVWDHMVAQGAGTILTVSSGAAHGPVEAWSHYCASKAGAAMMTRCAHLEGAEQGIRAMGLSPGTVATQMQMDIKASGINPVSQLDWADHIPPDWPARALVWMCGDQADGFCGEEISLRDENIRRRIGLL